MVVNPSTKASVLKNPILSVLREINISKILLQSNFIKCGIGFSPFQIILHFIYMLVMNKHQSAFVKQSADSYGVEPKYGKQIEGSGKSIYSNKEHRCVNGIKELTPKKS